MGLARRQIAPSPHRLTARGGSCPRRSCLATLTSVHLNRRVLAKHLLIAHEAKPNLRANVGRASGPHIVVRQPRPPACNAEGASEIDVFAVREIKRRDEAPYVVDNVAVIARQHAIAAHVTNLASIVVRANMRARATPILLGLVIHHTMLPDPVVAVKVFVPHASYEALFAEGKRAHKQRSHTVTHQIARALLPITHESGFLGTLSDCKQPKR